MKKILIAFGIFLGLISISLVLMFTLKKDLFMDYLNHAIKTNIPFVKNFVQKEFATYTSITGIRDEMKLVTAKQQLDFINIMEGKDGRYIEISTFEVKAGIDFSKISSEENPDGTVKMNYPPLEIFSSNKVHSVVPRSAADKNNIDLYETGIKPVNIAYAQKAKDYAIELNILENARKGAERTLNNLIGAQVDMTVDNYLETYEIKYLPFELKIYENYFAENNISVVPIGNDKFYRDSFLLESTSNDDWSIRVGDTGRTYDGTFEDFYRNIRNKNTNKDNAGKDLVQIYRYFDPMYPKESEVLGYASDSYRTMFFLNNRRIYYVDAVVKSEQTLINDIAPTMVYLATSMRKIITRKVEKYGEYRTYIENYFTVQEDIRNNNNGINIRNNTRKLIESNLKQDNNVDYSNDEKFFLALSEIKNIFRTENQTSITQTGESFFDTLTELIRKLSVAKNNFNDENVREEALEATTALDSKIYRENNTQSANTQYLLTYFLQKKEDFKISNEQYKQYEDDMKSGNIYVASRPMIINLSDSDRNEYFYNLFRSNLALSHLSGDTANSVDERLEKSIRDSVMFVYYDIPTDKKKSDGDILEGIKKRNGNNDIRNCFVFIFSQTEWAWGSFADDDIHALILDEATLRIFPNILHEMDEKVEDVAITTAETIITPPIISIPTIIYNLLYKGNNQPIYYYYGDWQKLKITPENVTIGGVNFGTKRITKKAKAEYRESNDYGESSTIAAVLENIQRAYSSNNEADYYYDLLCNNIENQIQEYVYDIIFRPSPRIDQNNVEDQQYRYNR